jgi:hypothetical protein
MTPRWADDIPDPIVPPVAAVAPTDVEGLKKIPASARWHARIAENANPGPTPVHGSSNKRNGKTMASAPMPSNADLAAQIEALAAEVHALKMERWGPNGGQSQRGRGGNKRGKHYNTNNSNNTGSSSTSRRYNGHAKEELLVKPRIHLKAQSSQTQSQPKANPQQPAPKNSTNKIENGKAEKQEEGEEKTDFSGRVIFDKEEFYAEVKKYGLKTLADSRWAN